MDKILPIKSAALLLVAAAGLDRTILAQESETPSSSALDAPSSLGRLANADSELGLPSGQAARLSTPFHWGPVNARPHLDYSVVYGDGLQVGPGVSRETLTQTVSPGVTFEIGRGVVLNYTPSLIFYSQRDFRDTLAQHVSFLAAAGKGEWRFGVNQAYSLSDDPLIETARQTSQEIFATGLKASRPFGGKWLLELGADQNIRDAGDLNSTRSWSTMEWVHYQFATHFSTAVGAGYGYDDVSQGSDMMSEKLEARLDSRIARKLNLTLHGGAEDRQFVSGGKGDLLNPIYGAAILYRPFDYTTLSLSGDRRIRASLLRDEVTQTTDISLSLSQRLLGRLFMTVSGSFGNTEFISSSQALAVNRSDDVTRFMTSLGYGFWKRAYASIFYQRTENSSSQSGFTFTSSQVGLNLGYHF